MDFTWERRPQTFDEFISSGPFFFDVIACTRCRLRLPVQVLTVKIYSVFFRYSENCVPQRRQLLSRPRYGFGIGFGSGTEEMATAVRAGIVIGLGRVAVAEAASGAHGEDGKWRRP